LDQSGKKFFVGGKKKKNTGNKKGEPKDKGSKKGFWFGRNFYPDPPKKAKPGEEKKNGFLGGKREANPVGWGGRPFLGYKNVKKNYQKGKGKSPAPNPPVLGKTKKQTKKGKCLAFPHPKKPGESCSPPWWWGGFPGTG